MKDIHEVLRRKQAQYTQLGKQIEMLQQAAEKLREVAPLLAAKSRPCLPKMTTRTIARCWRKWTTKTPTRWPPRPALSPRLPRPSQRAAQLHAGHKSMS